MPGLVEPLAPGQYSGLLGRFCLTITRYRPMKSGQVANGEADAKDFISVAPDLSYCLLGGS